MMDANKALLTTMDLVSYDDLCKGPFKYYVIKEVGGWGQKILDDLQHCKSSKRWMGGPKKVKNVMT